jgi:hypothetical protein
VDLLASIVIDNRALGDPGRGGGLYIDDGGAVCRDRRTRIEDNRASDEGDDVFIAPGGTFGMC